MAKPRVGQLNPRTSERIPLRYIHSPFELSNHKNCTLMFCLMNPSIYYFFQVYIMEFLSGWGECPTPGGGKCPSTADAELTRPRRGEARPLRIRSRRGEARQRQVARGRGEAEAECLRPRQGSQKTM